MVGPNVRPYFTLYEDTLVPLPHSPTATSRCKTDMKTIHRIGNMHNQLKFLPHHYTRSSSAPQDSNFKTRNAMYLLRRSCMSASPPSSQASKSCPPIPVPILLLLLKIAFPRSPQYTSSDLNVSSTASTQDAEVASTSSSKQVIMRRSTSILEHKHVRLDPAQCVARTFACEMSRR